MVHNLACNEQTHLQVSLLFCLPYKRKGVYMTRKKMLLFTLVISMGTVWRLLELLEYGDMAGAILDSRRKPTMKESSNAILCLNEAERRKYQNVH